MDTLISGLGLGGHGPMGVTDTQSRRIIAVAGPCGHQGHAVIKALKHHGYFRIRSIVRDKNIPEARKLSSMSELVQGDIAHPESLRSCLLGCYGFFCMTDCWDPQMAGREAELGKAMAKLALDCGIDHFMFSTQPDPSSESKGNYNLPSFSGKAEVEKFASTLGFKFHTYLAPSFYFQNWDELCCPVKEGDGVFTFKLPISDQAFISSFDVDELGECALNAFLHPLAWGNGEVVPLVASHMHPSDYLSIIEQHSHQNLRFQSISGKSFVKCTKENDLPGGDELAEWFRWIEDFGYFGSKYNISDGHKLLGRPLNTFQHWVKHSNFKIAHWQNLTGGIASKKGKETFHGSRIGGSAAAGDQGLTEMEREGVLAQSDSLPEKESCLAGQLDSFPERRLADQPVSLPEREGGLTEGGLLGVPITTEGVGGGHVPVANPPVATSEGDGLGHDYIEGDGLGQGRTGMGEQESRQQNSGIGKGTSSTGTATSSMDTATHTGV